MSAILDELPREWRQPVGRIGAGFTIGMFTGAAGGLAPILQEFVMTFKVPASTKKLGLAGTLQNISRSGLGLGTFFAFYQVRSFCRGQSLVWECQSLLYRRKCVFRPCPQSAQRAVSFMYFSHAVLFVGACNGHGILHAVIAPAYRPSAGIDARAGQHSRGA